jgi:hypothetical protein
MKPRVFVSSTFYDLKQIRADLDNFITSLSFEPARHEEGDIPYDNEKTLENYCYDEIKKCDIIVSIIGGRFGVESSYEKEFSISQKELKVALQEKKQVYVFIDKNVYIEYGTYLKNKNSDWNASSVDDKRIFSFIEYIKNLGLNNPPIKDFEYAKDIIDFLKKQFAGLFQKFLSNRKRTNNFIDDNIVRDLRELGIVETTNKLSDTKFDPNQCMEEICFSLSFMGILGSKWVKDIIKFEKFLKKIQAQNGQVRFLMINPYSESFSKLRDMREQNIKDTTTDVFSELVNKYSCLQAKYYDFIPCFRLIFIDNKTVAVSRYGLDEKNYFKTKQGWDAPHLVIQRDYNCLSLFDPFQSYYNWVWNNAKDVKKIK